jgi:hypothetical protein
MKFVGIFLSVERPNVPLALAAFVALGGAVLNDVR